MGLLDESRIPSHLLAEQPSRIVDAGLGKHGKIRCNPMSCPRTDPRRLKSLHDYICVVSLIACEW